MGSAQSMVTAEQKGRTHSLPSGLLGCASIVRACVRAWGGGMMGGQDGGGQDKKGKEKLI